MIYIDIYKNIIKFNFRKISLFPHTKRSLGVASLLRKHWVLRSTRRFTNSVKMTSLATIPAMYVRRWTILFASVMFVSTVHEFCLLLLKRGDGVRRLPISGRVVLLMIAGGCSSLSRISSSASRFKRWTLWLMPVPFGRTTVVVHMFSWIRLSRCLRPVYWWHRPRWWHRCTLLLIVITVVTHRRLWLVAVCPQQFYSSWLLYSVAPVFEERVAHLWPLQIFLLGH